MFNRILFFSKHYVLFVFACMIPFLFPQLSLRPSHGNKYGIWLPSRSSAVWFEDEVEVDFLNGKGLRKKGLQALFPFGWLFI